MIAGMTLHALARMQQRGIPEQVLNLLLDFGQSQHDHRGAEILYFGKRALRQVERAAGHSALREVERHRRVYAVVTSEGGVSTVGHRNRKLNRV